MKREIVDIKFQQSYEDFLNERITVEVFEKITLNMKICYIAHPISGDIEGNLADIRRIVKRINLEYPEIVPFVPYYSDVVSMDDTIPELRQRGILNDITILKSGIVDELWLTGEKVSSGMQEEIYIAVAQGIEIKNLIKSI